jgi:hypothetical protein
VTPKSGSSVQHLLALLDLQLVGTLHSDRFVLTGVGIYAFTDKLLQEVRHGAARPPEGRLENQLIGNHRPY